MFGIPFAIPLQRCVLALPHALTAVTHTCEPAGIAAGKRMLQLVPEGETTAPGTVVLQLYDVAPDTAAIEKEAEAPGQTYEAPEMIPGCTGVLEMARLRTVLLKPQFREAYTLRFPEFQPAGKFTVMLVEAVVSVLVPPLMVAPPVTVQV